MCRGVECRRVAVGFGKGLRQGALGQPRRLVEHLPNRLRVQVAELARRKCLLQVQHLKQVELQIAHVALVVTQSLAPFRYGLTVGLWPTDARGSVGLGWFCAKPVHVPRCPATHGTPFIVGTGPPETTVGAPL
jgi:hypothetical protein